MKNKITSAIALIIFSVALVITSLIPALLAPKNQEGNNVSDVKMGIAISTKLNE